VRFSERPPLSYTQASALYPSRSAARPDRRAPCTVDTPTHHPL